MLATPSIQPILVVHWVLLPVHAEGRVLQQEEQKVTLMGLELVDLAPKEI